MFGFGSVRELFRIWMKVRLGSRFVAVTLVRNFRCLQFALALVLDLCGSSLGSVLLSWLRMTICGLVLGVGVRQRGDPWPNFCPVGISC